MDDQKISRFDYVKYDSIAMRDQEEAKKAVQLVERTIEMIMPAASRAKALALTSLEECYMWIGKGIRDDQVLAPDRTAPLQEARTDS